VGGDRSPLRARPAPGRGSRAGRCQQRGHHNLRPLLPCIKKFRLGSPALYMMELARRPQGAPARLASARLKGRNLLGEVDAKPNEPR
jgi:hypothetical protein